MAAGGQGNGGDRPEYRRPKDADSRDPTYNRGSRLLFFLVQTIRSLAPSQNSPRTDHMAWSVPWQFLGQQVSGDVGGFTIYTDMKRRKVVFEKSPPEKPPSQLQLAAQARFRQAHAQWKALPDQVKQDLENACRKLWIPMTGKNLKMHGDLMNDQAAIDTVSRQSGIPLPAVIYIP